MSIKNFESFSTKKSNTENFIQKSREVHGADKYDYSLVEYKNNNTKVIIICKIHGIFEQIPRSHTSGVGCPKCGKGTINKDLFIKKSKEVHGDRYDYTKVNDYNFQNTKNVEIICKSHGSFYMDPKRHINGNGCSKCSGNRKLTTDEFIEMSKSKYSEYGYIYDKTDYNGYYNKVIITCPNHGDFSVVPSLHLNGISHCNSCSKRKKWNFEYFVNTANKIHNNKYKYDIKTYKNSNKKTKITCPKHGDFWQLPESHIRNGNGCSKCVESKGEIAVLSYLNSKKIKFIRYKKFDDCFYIQKLTFDFYLPDYNTCIEFDGIQHFVPRERFGGLEEFEKIQIRDKIKDEWCLNNKVTLVRISRISDIEEKLSFLN